MSAKYKERLAVLESLLKAQNGVVNIAELRKLCENGIEESLRPLCWRLLLGYMPLDRGLWKSFLKKQRETFEAIVQEIIVEPGKCCIADGLTVAEDHPLSLSSDSEWKEYFKDNELLLQIDKDVRRLCPEIEFFQKATNFPCRSAARSLSKRISQETLKAEVCDRKYSGMSGGNLVITNLKTQQGDCTNTQADSVDTSEYHWEVVERILFVYSKLNPGVKYVQGMNEIVGPLYYVFATDHDRGWAKYAEADTYYCFQILMSEIKDNFIKTLDNSNCGISWSMNQFCEMLRSFDVQLYNHLVVDLGIKPQFFAFRWISLLLSQEFSLPDVIVIWDSIFSSENRAQFLHWICIAMMEREREALMSGDFSSCLRLLQNIPAKNVYELVRVAFDLRDGNYKVSLPKTEDDGNRKFKFEPANRFAAAFANSFRNFTKK